MGLQLRARERGTGVREAWQKPSSAGSAAACAGMVCGMVAAMRGPSSNGSGALNLNLNVHALVLDGSS